MIPLNEWLELYAKEIDRKEKEVCGTLMAKFSKDKWFKEQTETDTWKAHKELALKSLEDARNRICVVRLEYRIEPRRDFVVEGNELRVIEHLPIDWGCKRRVKASEVETFCKNILVGTEKPIRIMIEDSVVAGEAIISEESFDGLID